MELSIPLPRTPDGRVYRHSPNASAYPRHFLIGDFDKELTVTDPTRERMKQVPRSKKTVCPYSGTVADDDEFTHPDDKKAALETVKHAARADIEDAFGRMFDSLARSTRGNKSVKVESKKTRRSMIKPRFVRKDLLREIICDHCGRDYGVYAIALFCPDCGAPNVRLHFAREAEIVNAQVELAEGLDAKRAELAYRVLGNAHEDVLTGFEATLKVLYQYGVSQRAEDAPAVKPVKNDFQNIERGKKRFAELGLDPFDQLDSAAMAALELNIQKRHVIGHNLGVVDPKFAEHASDARIGETVQLVAEDIKAFAAICQQVVDCLDAWLGGGIPSPTIGAPTAMPHKAAPTIDVPDDASPYAAADKLDLELSAHARRLACWIAEHVQNGAYDIIDGESVFPAFPDSSENELDESLAELETDGFIDTHRTMGGGLPSFSPQTDLYLTFDPVVFGTNPDDDAALLVKLILDSGEESFSSAKLHEQTGWTRRRFNPVLALVVGQIDEQRLSGETGVDYLTSSFFLLAEDKVALKRFLKRISE